MLIQFMMAYSSQTTCSVMEDQGRRYMDENSLSRACRPAVKRSDCNSASWVICFVRRRDEEGREVDSVESREADLLSLARQGSANSTSKACSSLPLPFLFHIPPACEHNPSPSSDGHSRRQQLGRRHLRYWTAAVTSCTVRPAVRKITWLRLTNAKAPVVKRFVSLRQEDPPR